MPEGDAVWRTARRLHDGLAGAVLEGSDLRVPTLATADLSGRRTLEVVPRGKHLLHRLEGGLTLHSHLRMDGRWRVAPAAARYAAAHRHTTRALLWTAGVVAVGDQLGMLDLVRTDEEHRVVGHLGPDLLDPAFDLEVAVGNLLADPARPLVEALLDQRTVAGIGTIWASEPLFLEGIHPWTPAGRLGPDRLEALLTRTRRMMVRGCRDGRPLTTGGAGRGEETWVFGRRALPCRRCGTPVRTGVVGAAPQERMLAYCPVCQDGLAPHDDGAPQQPLGHRPEGPGQGRR
ncbi:Fpg/Nei family DNA glycosylase [Ornithinimicrobium avium]|uniref:DNA-(apurinic or apyrimidinic site) lyase n=1 Tax=Ornithinimicrobium avium TaxID=2283195 RepID=A0A345NID2_9MICO|nr:DNA-formamidopyrimidine glycosylase family protein [Ornithinimicrobium avium]AXH94790.1 Fpg/Nei family DNA glycosylase [Ornithinimicrobium avium]